MNFWITYKTNKQSYIKCIYIYISLNLNSKINAKLKILIGFIYEKNNFGFIVRLLIEIQSK